MIIVCFISSELYCSPFLLVVYIIILYIQSSQYCGIHLSLSRASFANPIILTVAPNDTFFQQQKIQYTLQAFAGLNVHNQSSYRGMGSLPTNS